MGEQTLGIKRTHSIMSNPKTEERSDLHSGKGAKKLVMTAAAQASLDRMPWGKVLWTCHRNATPRP